MCHYHNHFTMCEKRRYHTDFLFSKSSFIIGFGSIISLMGNYYEFNFSKTDKEDDLRALRSDWGVVGNDFRHAFDSIKNDKIHF